MASDVAVVGTKAYVLLGSGGLRVMDFTDPPMLHVLGDSPMPLGSRSLRIMDNLAYVASASAGLQIFDISNPVRAVLKGSYQLQAQQVKVAGNLAYVAGADGLTILDIRNPADPALVGRYAVAKSSATCVEVAGNYAYVGVNNIFRNGFHVIDVTDPTNPQVRNVFTSNGVTDIVAAGDRVYVAGYDGLRVFGGGPTDLWLLGTAATGTCFSVQLVGSVAYVAGAAPALSVVDVSGDPKVLGTYSSDFCNKATVAGDLVFLATTKGVEVLSSSHPESWEYPKHYLTAGPASDIAFSNGRAYVADGAAGLEIFDVKQTGELISLAQYTNSGFIGAVTMRNNVAFLSRAEAGLQIVDFTEPGAPKVLGASPSKGNTYRVEVVGSLAYVADGTGILIIDTGDETSPRVVGSYASPTQVTDVRVSGNIACLAALNSGVLILDVSNPTAPTLLGVYEGGFAAWRLFLQGTILYVADSNSGFDIVDLNTPAKPVQLGHFKIGRGESVLVVDKAAYVATSDKGFYVFDVSEPRAAKLKTVYAGNFVGQSQAAGNYVYVAHGRSGIMAVDRTKTAGPAKIAANSLLGFTKDAAVAGTRAFVADSEAGFQILDISNPAEPVALGHLDFEDSTLTVAVAGDYAYVATTYNLFIVDVKDPTKPAVLSKYGKYMGFSSVQPAANTLYLLEQYGYPKLHIVDVKDKTKPALLGVFEIGGAERMHVAGSRAYVSNYGLHGTANAVTIVDVSNPQAPVGIGGMEIKQINALYARENLLYCTLNALPSSLQIWDVSLAGNPLLKGSCRLDGYPYSVRVVGNRAYIAGPSGLALVDITNPDQPAVIGGFSLQGAQNAVVTANNVCLAAGAQGFLMLEELWRLTIGASAQTGEWLVDLSADTNRPMILEASGNLKEWAPVWTNGASRHYREPGGLFQNRFYRARQ